MNDDWSPGFAGPEGVGALERLFSFLPYMPLNQALVQAISQKSGYQQIAQSHLTTAANQITAYLKQQGTYF